MSDLKKPVSDKERAFRLYKDRVKKHGKPFFPYGVWHDVIAGLVVVALIIGLSVVWYSTAGCGELFNVSCSGDKALTAEEQEVMTGVITEEAEVAEIKEHYTARTGNELPAEKPDGFLMPLYEPKADPATTSYHPRPEWYFYFLFYLLIVFSHPETVILGTIGLPTIGLILMLAWPFLDRGKERRPSRRPVAMSMMGLAAFLGLFFTYQGSQAGKESTDAFSEEQMEMPGYAALFEGEAPIADTCKGCHILGGSGGTMGPDLDIEATRNRGVEWQIEHLRDPQSLSPGSQMPAYGEETFDEDEVRAVAEFLETLGAEE